MSVALAKALFGIVVVATLLSERPPTAFGSSMPATMHEVCTANPLLPAPPGDEWAPSQQFPGRPY